MARVDQQQADIEALIGDKYRILCRIGGGGMAQVLLARHRLHGGLFAVKILADHLAQDLSIVSRFKQEATTAASLSGHPNIVPIFDIGEGRGLHYLVMQFVCGEDLGSYLKREGPLRVPDAAGVIAQAAEALCWAEQKRVVHRDLKPANMHLDTMGRVKILDFGISKITDVADSLTRPGESLGTPFYMSPEQIRGEGCDTRSDLYSLGVVFFELLTGRRPFVGESATAVQMAHLMTPPPSLLSLDASLPPGCDTMVQRLLAKDRADRYQSAQELLDDLHRNGASSGPTTLRPHVDPGLQAMLDRTMDEGDAPVTACAPVEPAPAGTPPATAQAAAAGMSASVAAMPAPPATAPLQESPAKRSLVLPLGLGVAVLLLLAVAGLLWLLHGSHGAAPAATAAGTAPAAPPATVTDTHGTMGLVPAGAFVFGEDAPLSPAPRQTLTLPAFYLDQTEVANGEYARFAAATGHAAAKSTGSADSPVTGVSQQDAAAYCAWAGKRLPTEQEWEKGARGTRGQPYPWGTAPWTAGVPTGMQPVVSSPDRRSPYGMYNMAGNAWEWTASPFPASDRDFASMQQALHSSSFSHAWGVIKGGDFSPSGAYFFRAYMRRGYPSDQDSPVIGFRCAKAVPGS